MSDNQDEDKPPLLKSWRAWYLAVLSVLLLQIVIYYFISSAFV